MKKTTMAHLTRVRAMAWGNWRTQSIYACEQLSYRGKGLTYQQGNFEITFGQGMYMLAGFCDEYRCCESDLYRWPVAQ